jgi:hypothetical protein
MMMRGDLHKFNRADIVFEVMVTDGKVEITEIKCREAILPTDPNNPCVAAFAAAVHRYVDGDAA